MPDNYRAPGWFTRNVFNQLVAFLTRQGISVLGSRVLAVKGRTSEQWRTTPVNLLTHDGRRYLVAPRGETQWVRNLRAAGTGELRVGRRAESFRGRELADEEKVPVLRAYLRRWKAEVGIFFEGTGPDSSDDQLRAIAPKHPAFEVLPVSQLSAPFPGATPPPPPSPHVTLTQQPESVKCGTLSSLGDQGAAGSYVLPPARCPCAAVVPQPPGVRQCPNTAEDPASAEDPGSPGCPNPPYKPNPPHKLPVLRIYW